MSFLEANRRNEKKNKDVVVTSRIPEEDFEKFKSLCRETGYSVSEAIRFLILNEIHPKKRTSSPSSAPSAPVYTVSRPEKYTPEPVSTPAYTERKPVQETPKPKTFNPVVRSNLARFTTNKWKVDDFLPCPLCNEWVSSSNFSRHAKKTHDLSTKDIFTTYEAEADNMVATQKGLTSQ